MFAVFHATATMIWWNKKYIKEPTEKVDEFTYLWSVVSTTGGTDQDVEARLGKAKLAFRAMDKLWTSRIFGRAAKVKIFNTSVKAKVVLLCASESWTVTQRTVDRIQVFISKCLRSILNIHWPEEENGTGSVTHWDEVMTALPDKCYRGCHKATEEEHDRETLGNEIWRGKYICLYFTRMNISGSKRNKELNNLTINTNSQHVQNDEVRNVQSKTIIVTICGQRLQISGGRWRRQH